MGVHQDETHLVGLETEAIAPLLTISSRVHSLCSQYCMGTFYQVCWTGRMEGSVLMVYILNMLPMVSKELGKAHSKMMPWATMVEGGVVVTLGLLGLRADLGFVACELGLWAFRAGRGIVVEDWEGPFWDVPLIMLLMGSLNWAVFDFMVFLKLQGQLLQGGKV